MADHTAVVAHVADRVRAEDAPGVVAALHGLSETQRRAVWKVLRGAATSSTAATVVALGTAPGARSAADAAWSPLSGAEVAGLALEVLVERRPSWLEDLAAHLVGRDTAPGWGFVVVRALVRDGLIARPTDPSYVLAMVHGLSPWTTRPEGRATVLAGLRADPALLEPELWTLLGTERAGRALAFHDSWHLSTKPNPGRPAPEPRPEATWQHALLALTQDGTLPRDRVLDTVLHAMLADWAAVDVGWFVDLHEALAPTADEVETRVATYLRLLASELGTVVQVGLRTAGRLLDAGRVDAADLAAALEPALLRPQKGTALTALRLAERLADGGAVDHRHLAAVVRAALDHPHADVRERARDLVERWTPAEQSEHLTPADPGLEARDLEGRLEPVAAPVPRSVEPVRDADELVELLAHLLEEADDPVGVERALDGVLRFPRITPAASEALARRADERSRELYPEAWSGQELRADLAALTLIWLRHRVPGPGYAGRVVSHDFRQHSSTSFSSSEVRGSDWSLTSLVTLRVHEVASHTWKGTRNLLSLPTSDDGSLSAAALNARLRGRVTAPPLDLELALLRVHPDEWQDVRLPRLLLGRGAAVQALATLRSHPPRWERVVGAVQDEWQRPDPTVMVGWSDPAGPRGAPHHLVRAALDRREPLARAGLEANDGEYAMRPEQITALWPLMLPHHLDHLAAHAHPRLARALGKNRSGAVPLLQEIGRSPNVGTGPTASALTLGLAAKDPAVRTSAVDALILRAGRGLLDPSGLAEQIRLCLADDVVVGTRLVDSLTEASRVDRPLAAAVLDVVGGVLEAVPGRRDAHRWVDLAAELTTDLHRTVVLPPAFATLAGGSERSVLAKACRRVRTQT